MCSCRDFPCADVFHQSYSVPGVEINPQDVSIILISEAVPGGSQGRLLCSGEPLFAQTTLQAFNDAGAQVSSMQDILNLGVYLTSAVKCAKTAYAIRTDTVKQCANLLAEELALFPNVKAYLLMGDVAIKAFNTVARQTGEKRVIPAGSTYKIRGQPYFFHGRRAFPSYLQAGPSFFIEKSKRKMIAEDIAAALRTASAPA